MKMKKTFLQVLLYLYYLNISLMKFKKYYYIYVAKIILHYNSKNLAIILTIIVNCEMCIATDTF